jgi:NAD(P)-dependent dehydrogenase (short-subunit alcohol dehydrogenase family)
VAAFHAVQLAIPRMVERGGGTIVNLSSGAARNAMEGWSAYCAGKAGLAMLTQCIAKEFGDQGLRAFGFAPGVVDTEMQVRIRASGINPVSQLPRASLLPPDQPGWAIAWLCTPEADPLAGQEVDIRHEPFRKAAAWSPSHDRRRRHRRHLPRSPGRGGGRPHPRRKLRPRRLQDRR